MRRFDTSTKPLHTGSFQARTALLIAAFLLSSSAALAQSNSKLPEAAKPQPTRRIVVNIPDRKLALLEDGRIVKIYDVAVGAHVSPSPSGEFQIAKRLSNPTYYKPGVVIGPGPGNPLGTRWLGLNIKGFGIHGTNRPCFCWQKRLTRVHTPEEFRCGRSLCARSRRRPCLFACRAHTRSRPTFRRRGFAHEEHE